MMQSTSSQLPEGLSPAYWRIWYSSRDTNISESLDAGETWIGGWNDVGLYEGNNKIPSYQNVTIHITTHRLIIVPSGDIPVSVAVASTSSQGGSAPALQAHMSNVRQTELYAGFMKSSPKITLTLGPPPNPTAANGSVPDVKASDNGGHGAPGANDIASSWTCGVCGYVNPVLSFGPPGPSTKCSLCGVAYTPSRISTPAALSSSASPAGTSVISQRPSTPSTPLPKQQSEPVVSPDGRIPCPACTFLNHPSLLSCEICSTPLPSKRKAKPSLNSSATPLENGLSINRTATDSPKPGLDGRVLPTLVKDGQDVIRFSFRKGGVQDAYRRLKNVLSDKAWARQTNHQRHNAPNGAHKDAGGRSDVTPSRPSAGIDGILQSISLEAKTQDGHMQDAFKDLEVLMVRAGEMVKLAQSLNAKLTAQQASSSAGAIAEEDATLIRSSLVQLGLSAPALTQDMVRDETKYHQGLAKELGQLLTGSGSDLRGQPNAGSTERGGSGGLMSGKEGRGVIALDEVWGLWMRARGVALLPPATLISILPYIPAYTNPPVNVLIFPSRMKVLHTPAYEPSQLMTRILARLSPSPSPSLEQVGYIPGSDDAPNGRTIRSGGVVEPSISLFELASHENLPIGLAKELMEMIELLVPPQGVGEVYGLVRDDQADQASGGTRWYRDIISIWQV